MAGREWTQAEDAGLEEVVALNREVGKLMGNARLREYAETIGRTYVAVKNRAWDLKLPSNRGTGRRPRPWIASEKRHARIGEEVASNAR